MDDFRDLMYDLILESLVDKLDNYEITMEDAEIFSEAAYDELFYESRAVDRWFDKADGNALRNAMKNKNVDMRRYLDNLNRRKEHSDDAVKAMRSNDGYEVKSGLNDIVHAQYYKKNGDKVANNYGDKKLEKRIKNARGKYGPRLGYYLRKKNEENEG